MWLTAQLVGGIGGYEFLESDANHILPPGQRIVITSDLAAFTAAYPEVPASRIAGRPYAGRRNNGGETITLSDPAGGVIQRFRYDDRTSEGWYDETDGEGFSLVATGKPPPNWRQGPSESPRAAAS